MKEYKPDDLFWLNGSEVPLKDIPLDKVGDAEVVIDGKRIRPFRFASGFDDNPFL